MFQIKKLCQTTVLVFALIGVLTAQAAEKISNPAEVSTNIVFGSDEAAPAQAVVRQDPALVGTWVGRTAGKSDVIGCIAYDWRTERAADGTLNYTAFDAHSTLSDDKGHWWTEGDTYYELIDGASAYKYRYQVEGNELILRSKNKEEQACLTDKTLRETKAEMLAS